MSYRNDKIDELEEKLVCQLSNINLIICLLKNNHFLAHSGAIDLQDLTLDLIRKCESSLSDLKKISSE